MSQGLAFVLTVSIEAIVIILFYRRSLPAPRLFVIALSPSLFTHPFLWTATKTIPFGLSYGLWVLLCEVMVSVIEAILLKLLTRKNALYCLMVSVVANALSTLAGLAWYLFFLH